MFEWESANSLPEVCWYLENYRKHGMKNYQIVYRPDNVAKYGLIIEKEDDEDDK